MVYRAGLGNLGHTDLFSLLDTSGWLHRLRSIYVHYASVIPERILHCRFFFIFVLRSEELEGDAVSSRLGVAHGYPSFPQRDGCVVF